MREQVDLAVAEIGARQHGVISVRQLRTAGLDKSAVTRRVRAGRLHRLHRGVYAVGHLGVSREGEWMAAVLASGDGAVLSHRSAATHWGLLPPASGPVDLAVPSQAGRAPRSGIRLHRCLSLTKRAVTIRDGIPVTIPARTIADLNGFVSEWEWRKAVRQAEFEKLPIGSGLGTDGTRSDLESDFLWLCRRHGLRRPDVNVKLGRWTVDFVWRPERVAVETDFYDFHRGKIAFQDDRRRDLELRQLGFDVRHFSEQLVNEQPETVAADIAAALDRGGGSVSAAL
jgi:very-short-patch-repair endonuclease